MMRALLRMDWVVMRRYLLIGMPFYVGNALLFSFHAGAYLAGHAMLVTGLVLLTLLLEEREGCLVTTASLPVSRARVVLTRYIWALVIAAVCFGLALLYNAGLVRLVGRFAADTSALTSSQGILGYTTTVILCVAVVLPLYYRHGLGPAVGGLAMAGLVALTSSSVVFALLGGSTWRYDRRAAIQTTLGSLERCMGKGEIQVAWTGGLVLLVVASLWLATRALKAREL